MGAGGSSPSCGPPARPLEPVILHVYSLSKSDRMQALNKILRRLGTGAFHCGVEVYGHEFSFRGGSYPGTGVFWQTPRSNRFHTWVEALPMGMTSLSQTEVMALVKRLRGDWPSATYDVLDRNCCHFCEEFCRQLGAGTLPSWVTHLAGTGAAIAGEVDAVSQVCCDTEVAACMGCDVLGFRRAPRSATTMTLVQVCR